MGIVIKAPDSSNAVTIQQSTNVSKTIEASDIASDSYFKNRVGTSGGFSFRNKIIDGRFDFWYEGTSQTTNGYGSDTMWFNAQVGGSKVHTRQLLTAGADLPSIEVPSTKYFSRTVVTSVAGASNQVRKYQVIEDVRTLAGKTVTVSFYAKADAVKNIALSFEQNFGTGGSTVLWIPVSLVSLTTTWARYSSTVTLPSVSGKTIGADNGALVFSLWFDAGSAYNSIASSLGQRSGTYDVCCIQIEEGSVATPFEETPIEVSQQRVHRYYQYIPMSSYKPMLCGSTVSGYLMVDFLSPMRAPPALTLLTSNAWIAGTAPTVTASSTNTASTSGALINITVASGLTNMALAMVSGSGLNADARL